MIQSGIELITQERKEQLEKHNFSIDHDIELHNKKENQELALNASILASPYVMYDYDNDPLNFVAFRKFELSRGWKLPSLNYNGSEIIDNCKLRKQKRIKQLIVAGALIAAEIDRLNNIK